jgi:uncharacterized protein
MAKKYFMVIIHPPRPDFDQTKTDDEFKLIVSHELYWRILMKKGHVVVFGPVLDPKGIYGMAVVAAESTEELDSFIKSDPGARINHYEYYQMQAIIHAMSGDDTKAK